MRKFCTTLLTLLAALAANISALADGYHGTVRSADGAPLAGARVYWAETTVGTITDSLGCFTLHGVKEHNRLVATFVGLEPDTIEISPDHKGEILITMGRGNATTGEVVVHASQRGNSISSGSLSHTENISFAGLTKLACCTVAESFENSASVTVGYSDAISGARQIKMLGLAGAYTQILDESRPIMRGIGSPYALTYTPGMWLKSIQVSKGISSVAAGHDAITGQINMEYRKPTDEEKLFANVYFDDMLRPEANLAAIIPLKKDKSLSTIILAHGSADTEWREMGAMDRNNDGYRDLPSTSLANIANRWLYTAPSGLQARWGWRALADRRVGGNLHFDGSRKMRDEMETSWADGAMYGSRILNKAVNAYAKVALPVGKSVYNPEDKSEKRSSVAAVIDYDHFGENAYYGLNNYNGQENDFTASLMFTNYFDLRSSLTVGAQTRLAAYRERLQNRTPWIESHNLTDTSLNRNENEAGVYAEYTYDVRDRLTVMGGLRADYNGLQKKALITPRAHLKWSITPRTTLRASAGMGYRTSNIITDNMGILATGRHILINSGELSQKSYDSLYKIEETLTAGASLTQTFTLGRDNSASLSLDFFHTRFFNSVIADTEWNPTYVNIYSSHKRAVTDNLQIDFNWAPIERFDVLLTFRHTSSRMALNRPDGSVKNVERPLISEYKGLANLSYATKFRLWVFDFTAQLNGPSRIPTLTGDLDDDSRSPVYATLFAQVTHKVGKADIYAGCENITDYRQKNPIVEPENPFSTQFNSMNVWGPLMGRKFYIGLRLNVY